MGVRKKMKNTKKDYNLLKKAAEKTEKLTRKVENWNSTEEIRKWREKRH